MPLSIQINTKQVKHASRQQIETWANEITNEFDRILSDNDLLIDAVISRQTIKDKNGVFIKDKQEITKALSLIDNDPNQTMYSYDEDRTKDQFSQWSNELSISEQIRFDSAIFEALTLVIWVNGSCYNFYNTLENTVKLDELVADKQHLMQVIRTPLLAEAVEQHFKKQLHDKLKQLEHTENEAAGVIRDSISQMVKDKDPLFSLSQYTKILEGVSNTLSNPGDPDPILTETADKINQLSTKKSQQQLALQHGLYVLGFSCLLAVSAGAIVASCGTLAPVLLPVVALAALALVTAIIGLPSIHESHKAKKEAIEIQSTLKNDFIAIMATKKVELGGDDTTTEEDRDSPSPGGSQ